MALFNVFVLGMRCGCGDFAPLVNEAGYPAAAA